MQIESSHARSVCLDYPRPWRIKIEFGFPMQNRLFDENLIGRYNAAVPRYTSYPTAPQFHPLAGERAYRECISESNAELIPRSLSLYIHIPFCSTVCFYCACNKIVTKNRFHAETYLDILCKEIELQGKLFDRDRRVIQMHWGGGTPTFLNDVQMRRLMDNLQQHFYFGACRDEEFSIELDPREVSPDSVRFLNEVGFNRISIGVQDTDPRVQKAINRIQPVEKTLEIFQAARDQKFKSINFDLIYGLPLQTVSSFAATLEDVIEMQPDRLSVFNYAHLPQRFKTQKQINQADLPSSREKLEILKTTTEQLIDAGYVYIGMDHFARPGDELAIAQQEGTLHRNFQGYSTHGNCDLIGLGVSSIGDIGGNYFQNHHDIKNYEQNISQKRLAISRGYRPTRDDQIRRAVIHELICHFKIDTEHLAHNYGISFTDYFKQELKNLERLEADGLIETVKSEIRITPVGRLLVRNVCSVFDVFIKQDNVTTFSKAI